MQRHCGKQKSETFGQVVTELSFVIAYGQTCANAMKSCDNITSGVTSAIFSIAVGHNSRQNADTSICASIVCSGSDRVFNCPPHSMLYKHSLTSTEDSLSVSSRHPQIHPSPPLPHGRTHKKRRFTESSGMKTPTGLSAFGHLPR